MYDRPQNQPLIEAALRRAFEAEQRAPAGKPGYDDVFDDLLSRLAQCERQEDRHSG